MGEKIVIIGGVATGPKAASRARRHDNDAEITIIERGDIFSYAGCGMPLYIEGLIDDVGEFLCTPTGVMKDEMYFKSIKDVDIRGKTEALKINRTRKTVTVKDLEADHLYDIPYDKLVLAVGARPLVPRMEGIDLEGVHRLYDPRDAEAIRKEFDAGVQKVAIIGGGLIGMELCGPFVSKGCEVTILEMMDQLLPALLDRDIALLLEKYLREEGVDVRTGSRVEKLIGNGSGRVTAVITANGSRFETDIVLVAIGVRPNVELAVGAGLEIGETGAIAVDECLQTSDPDIYAGGDCVENTCLITGRKVYVPLGSTANKHGRVIGDNVAGGETRFPGVASTTVLKVLEFNVGATGLSEMEAQKIGYDVVTSLAPKTDSAHYYPMHRSFVIKLVVDRKTGRLLGGQALGRGEAVKRIDVAASSIMFGATVKDMADLDLGYAPPYSTALDPIAHAANIIRNKIKGLAHGISAVELKARIDGDRDFLLLDVRSPGEVNEHPFIYNKVRNIPLGELRQSLDEIPRDKEVIVFCRTGVRAYEAQRILSSRGFSNVKFLEGSLAAWPY